MVPRSPLHKETIYGKIKVDDGFKTLKQALQNINLIKDDAIRRQLGLRLQENDGDIAKTIKALKKDNLEINGKSVANVRCYREEIVVKYPIESIKSKDVSYIVDSHIRSLVQQRFAEVGNSDKEFVKSLSERPLYSDKDCKHQIKTIRLISGLKLSTLAGVRKNEAGETIGYAQTRNNHHLAFYRTTEGKIVESVRVALCGEVSRKEYGYLRERKVGLRASRTGRERLYFRARTRRSMTVAAQLICWATGLPPHTRIIQ